MRAKLSDFDPIAGNGGSAVRCVSPAMQALERTVADVAPTDIPVLLVGESGTGKEVLARRIHGFSSRRDGPLVKVSCASLNAESLSALLRDAEGRSGTNGESDAGSVFFDEISELDSICQRNLLCALPDGDAAPRPRSLAARLISSTSRNLEQEIQAGRFRSELYYRINGVCLRLPPLRQRKEDISILAHFFLAKYAGLFGRPRPSISAQILSLLLDYSWPGNIRELENVIRKIVALGDEQAAVADLTATPARPWPANREPKAFSLKEAARAASRQAEREMILKVLTRTRWNRKRAAQELQISYKSLLSKLKQIGWDDSETTGPNQGVLE